MSSCVIWLDSQNAKVFHVSAAGVQKKELHRHGTSHSNGHVETHAKSEEEKFYHEVAQAVGHAEELLVMGPGVAKSHFKTHLENHRHQDLMKHLIGVESLDSVSDNQVLEAARKHFKKFHQFNT